MVLFVQSSNFERVLKLNKIIHTKARNRLHTTTVHMLFYIYINLRLLKKCSDELDDFLIQYIDEEEKKLKKNCSEHFYDEETDEVE